MQKLSNNKYYPYLWLTPVIIILTSILIYPWLWSFVKSFQDWVLINPADPEFNGLNNYITLFKSDTFWLAVKNTLLFLVTNVTGQFIVGFIIALLLNTKGLKGRNVFLTGFLIPMMLTPVIVGVMWKMLLHSNFGVVNYLLSLLGIEGIPWLSNPIMVKVTINIIEIWRNFPFVTLILLAGLQSMPEEMIEAARIDGASKFQLFRYITLPWLKKLIAIALLFRTMYTLRIFDTIYGLFHGGGPANSGMLLGVYLYQYFRMSWNIGVSSAISFAMLFITIAVSLIFLKSLYKERNE